MFLSNLIDTTAACREYSEKQKWAFLNENGISVNNERCIHLLSKTQIIYWVRTMGERNYKQLASGKVMKAIE